MLGFQSEGPESENLGFQGQGYTNHLLVFSVTKLECVLLNTNRKPHV
jgi:hypothetical protein